MQSRWRRPVLGLVLVVALLLTTGFQVQAAPGAAPDQIPDRPLDGTTGSPVHATGLPVHATGSPASSRAFAGGAGTADDPYQVATAAHLNSVRNHLGAYFVQTADIDLSANWEPIGGDLDTPIPFTGMFDGQGHKITNLTIHKPAMYYVGLFRYLGDGAIVANLGLEDVSIVAGGLTGALAGVSENSSVESSHSSGSVSGAHVVGGLLGRSQGGTVINCQVTDMEVSGIASDPSAHVAGGLVGESYASTIVDSHSDATVNGYWAVGGLVGNHYDSTTIRSYSTGSVHGDSDVGGLMGLNDTATVVESYSLATVRGAESGGPVGGLIGQSLSSTITHTYSAGSVQGDSAVGGLVGFSDATTYASSFWDRQASGQTVSAGGESRSTAEMQQAATFTDAGWDFVHTWSIDEGVSYPYLQWSVPSLAPTVVGIAPESGENTGVLTVTVSGADFQVGATLMLTRTGQPGIAASEVTVGSPLSLTGVLDLTDAAVGPWHVVVTNPDDQVGRLEDGFTVTITGTTQVTVDPETESTLVYTGTQGAVTTLVAPAGSVSETVTLVYTPMITATPFSGWTFAGLAFDLEAYEGADPLASYAFQQPVTLTIGYTDSMIVGLDEESLTLTKWVGGAWKDVAETCAPPSTYVRDLAGNRLSVPICHLSSFALFGTEEAAADYQVYLPLVVR